MTKHIALLRGINVGGHRRVPMSELRVLTEEVGFGDVRTYVASGNVVLASEHTCDVIESTLEQVIEQRFGFAVDVVARSAAQWTGYLNSNPFVAEGAREPNLVMLCIGKQPAMEGHAASLRERAGDNERVELRGDALWLYFGDGSGRSKMGLGPGAGTWTTRNLRTVRTIHDMLR
ncbi:DUF1697 domain-containing protein [Sphingomonas sp. IC-56]|uniref:DUF1697 domain-containing protein n=1 Tax=Sphingomonas sp. IC-56 TaxID=2898529 RepID=UPI001E2899B2|nr:DUF1697 domain-containing protein [Sphingomonas sp. IC-56]MCD2324023.1 DUF1697 domain-containing protein [Sphingomonas sp. IC-56]